MSRILAILLGLCLSQIVTAQAPQLPEGVLIRLRLLDPRLVTLTDTVFDTKYAGDTTDLIGTRMLTLEESKELWGLLEEECLPLEVEHLCGHKPIYAVEYVDGKTVTHLMTFSGDCKTWTRGGDLWVLGGFKSLDYMEKKLPPPTVFQWALRPRARRELLLDKPFFELKKPAATAIPASPLPNE